MPVKVAGRLLVMRDMGKSQFVKILDQQGLIQLYLKKDVVGEEAYAAFRKLDLGDIIGAEGTLFKTKSGEITVRVERCVLVAKALRPLPEKWHGLTDPEQVYRQRYLDVIVNDESRRRLLLRSRIVTAHPPFPRGPPVHRDRDPDPAIRGGRRGGEAVHTHHNALGCDFFLRISLGTLPEAHAGRAAGTACSRSGAISATRASRGNTTPSSPCSRSTRPTPTTAA